MITEVGGTVGDIEILPFLEAIRQFRKDAGRDNVCYVHVTLVPFIGPSGEQKTKPTQHSVTELRSRGIQPDVIVCRSEEPLSRNLKRKISNLCDVDERAVVNAADARNIYELPLILHDEGLDEVVCDMLAHRRAGRTSSYWESVVAKVEAATASGADRPDRQVRRPARRLPVGRREPEARRLPPWRRRCEIDWIQAEEVEGLLAAGRLADLDGMVIPGGFGQRGIEGKIAAAELRPRANGIPCLGLCLGMQVMTIEFARHVLGLADANSTEFDASDPPPGDRPDDRPARHRRQGRHDAPRRVLRRARSRAARSPRPTARWWSASATATATSSTPTTAPASRAPGFVCCGTSPDKRLVEFIELPGHPFWVGTQAHPEFKSRPDRPHPLFRELVGVGARPAPSGGNAEVDRRRPTATCTRRREPTDGWRLHATSATSSSIRGTSGTSVVGTFRRPTASTFQRDIVRSPRRGGRRAGAVRRRGSPTVVLVRQYRPAFDAEMIEIPAGMRDVDGEDPADDGRSASSPRRSGSRAGELERWRSFTRRRA